MKFGVVFSGNNYYLKPLFILKDPEKIDYFKELIEKVMQVKLDIRDYKKHKCIYVPYNLFFETLVTGLKIAEEKSIEGAWFNRGVFYSFNVFPLASYKKKDYALIWLFQEDIKKNAGINNKIEKYLKKLMTYLNRNLLILQLDQFGEEFEVCINCNIFEYGKIREMFLEFEKANLNNEILITKENYVSENILQRIKHK